MPTESDSPLSVPSTRQDMILEALLTVGEIRKPGYALKVMEQLTAQADGAVTELRPTGSAEHEANERRAAIAWLRAATIRARARAAERQRRKRERNR